MWKRAACHAPGSPCWLLRPQTFAKHAFGLCGHAREHVMQTCDPKNKSMVIRPSAEHKFLGRQADLPTVTRQLDERTNLPMSVASTDPLSKPAARANLRVTDEKNQNLSRAQKELLRWHFRLGHLNFKSIQLLLQSKTLGESSLKRAAGKCPLPECASCQHGKQKRRSTGATAQTPASEREVSLESGCLQPGQQVSVDPFHATPT